MEKSDVTLQKDRKKYQQELQKKNREVEALNREIAEIIRKATAYELKDRYQTADALAEDIRLYMAGQPISIKIENWLDRALRYFFE